jgi:hypothetical protein
MAHAVEIAGVEQAHAALERRVDGGDALALVRAAVHAGHAHAAEGDRKDRGPGLAELECAFFCGFFHGLAPTDRASVGPADASNQ